MSYLKILIIILAGLLSLSSLYSQQRPPRGGGGRMGPPLKTVKGQVIDESTGVGMEFATVSIYSKRDSSLAGGGLTGPDGQFSFSVKGFKLYAIVEFISYETKTIELTAERGNPIIDMGAITLGTSSVQLDDVEITAERSETTFSLDKRVFSVGKDLANRGGSAEDILNNVPSVDVDIEGVVSLRGSEGVRILIDGKPSNLVSDNANGLRNIPSNLIEQVEVITNPSARYEAEGMAGIINIVLKKDQGHGFNGSIDATAGLPTRAGLSANLNYRKGALNWFINYGINRRSGPGGGHTIQDFLVDNGGVQSRQLTTIDRAMDRGGLSNSIRFGTDYHINDKEQITLAASYRFSNNDNISDLLFRDYSDTAGDIGFTPIWNDTERTAFLDFDQFDSNINQETFFLSTLREDDEIEKEDKTELSLNYTKEFSSREHSLNASFQFQQGIETEDNIFTENREDILTGENSSLEQLAANEEKDQTILFQLDYVHPLGKDHKWEAGIRNSLREINTNYLVEENGVPIPGFQNMFDYDEDVIAGYGIYGNRINNYSFQVGLRGEYSLINTELLQSDTPPNDRTYFNFFPSGHVSYHFNDTDAIQLSYSRRIARPRFWDLNPFFTFSDNRNNFSGNPNLDPEYTDSYEVNHIKYWGDFNLSSSLYFRKTENSRQRILVSDQETSRTLRIPINIGTTENTGLDLSASYSFQKWLRISFNTNVFRNKLSLDPLLVDEAIYLFYSSVLAYEGTQEQFNSELNYAINEVDNIRVDFKLTTRVSFWNSDFQIRSNYRGARDTNQGRSLGIATVDLGWSKDFLPGKKLTLTVGVRDLFNSRKRQSLVFSNQFFQQSEFQWRARSGTITASYRINQKKKRGRPSGGSRAPQGGGEF